MLETMFDIVLKLHDQTLSVVEVITIPVIIQKRSVTYLFIGRSNNSILELALMWFGLISGRSISILE